jgi:SAM-dependent methyltransferase
MLRACGFIREGCLVICWIVEVRTPGFCPTNKQVRVQDTLVPAGSFRGAPIPWWGKIAAKLVLSRLPVPHSLWSKLNIFRHSYSSGDVEEQVRSVRDRVARFTERTGRLPHTILELGPGEITTCGVVYKALGIERTIFVDVGDFGSLDLAAYLRVAAAAASRGLAAPDLRYAEDRSQVFARCGVEYLVNGLADLQKLPAGSVDLVTSVAVIEHIRLSELAPIFVELRRILKDDGLAWHLIDFQDHLGGKLENLRFSPAVWESHWMSRSGFYTNRVGASRMIELMKDAGFDVEVESRSLWPEPPIAWDKVNRKLRTTWTRDDLRVCSMTVRGRVAKGPLP